MATCLAAGTPTSLDKKSPEYYWLWVLCVLGLDYFSTLAYQPSITFQFAGRLGPLATAVVVFMTLLGALPIYCYLAGRSPMGHGSIGLLERVVRGWRGKTLVLLLLGFAATDFTMLKTISLADAAVHVVRSEAAGWQHTLAQAAADVRQHATAYVGAETAAFFDEQLIVTLILGALGFLFWFLLRKGFNRNVIVLAVPLVALYLLLNALILVAGLHVLCTEPGRFDLWIDQLVTGHWLIEPPIGAGHGWASVVLVSLLFLPNLALGLSGFEMSMILMPQVRGESPCSPPLAKGGPGGVGRDAQSTPPGPPHARGGESVRGRIRNTRKVLIVAALVMSVYLLASSLVTSLLIPPEELAPGGKAANRALAYLAHGGRLEGVADQTPVAWFTGRTFGSLYDLTTVLVLSLAGTSVMTALAVLLPQFLLRFGMQLQWAQRWGLLLILFAVINFLVTLAFQADVGQQRGAYTTAVLVLMSSGGVVATLDLRQRQRQAKLGLLLRLARTYFALIATGLIAVTLAVALQSPSGLAIAALFIVAVLTLSVISRAVRADELRTIGFDFKDETSRFLWDSLRLADFPVLVPHRPGQHERDFKERQIRAEHNLDPDADIVFLEIDVDDPSNFFQHLLIEILQEDHRFIIKVTRCVSVAHAIAAIALEMSRVSKPPGLHFGWSEMNLLSASWSYFAFGEGNIPWKVRELIQHAEPDLTKRPRVIVG